MRQMAKLPVPILKPLTTRETARLAAKAAAGKLPQGLAGYRQFVHGWRATTLGTRTPRRAAELTVPEVVRDGFVLRQPDQGGFPAPAMTAEQRLIWVALWFFGLRVRLCGQRGRCRYWRCQSSWGMRGATGEGRPWILSP